MTTAAWPRDVRQVGADAKVPLWRLEARVPPASQALTSRSTTATRAPAAANALATSLPIAAGAAGDDHAYDPPARGPSSLRNPMVVDVVVIEFPANARIIGEFERLPS